MEALSWPLVTRTPTAALTFATPGEPIPAIPRSWYSRSIGPASKPSFPD
jgi:hypothetical protein